MARIGYFLSSEEWGPRELVAQARMAADAGFEALWISDHYHPWNDEQGQSPFVWGVVGALAEATQLPVTTAVTCPTIRIHPAVLAQAAATAAVQHEGRFVLGVGTGEALNEHVLGDRWPEAAVRLEMLEEAVEVMRLLWSGGQHSHRGRHYRVENARLYTLPDEPPQVYVSAFGPKAIELAGRIGDGFVTTAPDADALKAFRAAGGEGKPSQAGTKVCWGTDEAAARRTAHRLWANQGVPGELTQILPTPAHFEQASELVTEEMTGESIVCGPEIDRHVGALRAFVDAGYDEVYVNQIGPDQEAFFATYAKDVLPQLR
ncbi:LLM class F420-dependent oxidoreductase [soil metagenome]|jgi:G6PDH family F420-dependent oxidoreductase